MELRKAITQLFSIPVRILNVPLKVLETVVLDDEVGLDQPLDDLADSIDEMDEM